DAVADADANVRCLAFKHKRLIDQMNDFLGNEFCAILLRVGQNNGKFITANPPDRVRFTQDALDALDAATGMP
ncbi:MAG: hypothetical protein HQM02_10460, partial [Magnetococcales bacterium]|nr:hypothetical protein [Magnetococcales bacterium]